MSVALSNGNSVVSLLRVVVSVLVTRPLVDTVTDSEWENEVRNLLHDSGVTVEDVALEDTGEWSLTEGRHLCEGVGRAEGTGG